MNNFSLSRSIFIIFLCFCLIFTYSFSAPSSMSYALVADSVLVGSFVAAALSALGISFVNDSLSTADISSVFSDKVGAYISALGLTAATVANYFSLGSSGVLSLDKNAINFVVGFFNSLRSEAGSNVDNVEIGSVSGSPFDSQSFMSTANYWDADTYVIGTCDRGNISICWRADIARPYKLFYCPYTDGLSTKVVTLVAISPSFNPASLSSSYRKVQPYSNRSGYDESSTWTSYTSSGITTYYNAINLSTSGFSGYSFNSSIPYYDSLSAGLDAFISPSAAGSLSLSGSTFLDQTVLGNVNTFSEASSSDVWIGGVVSDDTEAYANKVFTGVGEGTLVSDTTISSDFEGSYEDPSDSSSRWLRIPVLGTIVALLQRILSYLTDLLSSLSGGFTAVLEQLGDHFEILGNYALNFLQLISGYSLFTSLFSHFLPPDVAAALWAFWQCIVGIWIFRMILNR